MTLERASLRWAGWEGAAGSNYAGSDAAPAGGFEALVRAVVSDAVDSGAVLQLGEQVTGIKEAKDGVQVTTPQGTYAARTVVCTIPLGVLQATYSDVFDPPLPPARAAVVAGTHVGVLEKLVLKYDSAWWPDAADVGSYVLLPTTHVAAPAPALDATSTVEQILSASTLIVANFATHSHASPTPVLVTYLSETPATLLLARPQRDVVQGYHAYLQQRFGATATATSAPLPTQSSMTSWLTDPLSRGATTTPCVVSDGERSPMDFMELSRPLWGGRLGFAGEHTEMENRGSVAGAVLSGFREAGRVGRWLDRHTQ
jgi:lysine-specific histone demethylase 1B